ncbi:MAG: Na+/H+ antiporter NhaA [Polyangiaceae bacterium]|nr:Na+/H+ antiporter NhaA [Polyangiaceae bacterium]
MANPNAYSPETWPAAKRAAKAVLRPIERFLHIEASSGIVLLLAAAAALFWANSQYAPAYEHLWHTPVRVGIGSLSAERSLHFIVNEVLMTIFFFVVGLEIRREIFEGELADRKRAMLPAVAAIGGMVAPAALFLLLSRPDTRSGFGVPTATDIAFAVGVLALLGKRVPPALRVLLLTLAIIDDIGAIVVIAAFYSKGIVWWGFGVALIGIVGTFVFQRLGIRRPIYYVIPGAVVWWGVYTAGVHPTIAGVALGLLTPARSWFGEEGFVSAAEEAISLFRKRSSDPKHTAHDLIEPLHDLRLARVEALSPVVRLQTSLHPWVAFVIMPVFALANAGVSLKGINFAVPSVKAIGAGVFFGLVIGKPLGIVLLSFIAVKLRICALPKGVRWSNVAIVGLVGGIGFTMSIFIAGLAFQSAEALAAAKGAILAASGVAACLGLIVGRAVLSDVPNPLAATSEHQAESSAEV